MIILKIKFFNSCNLCNFGTKSKSYTKTFTGISFYYSVTTVTTIFTKVF